MRLSKRERLRIFYDRLAAAPFPDGPLSALQLICDTLNEVEDEYSGEPQLEQPGLERTERMYPPFTDQIVLQPDGSIYARTVGHRIFITAVGEIAVYNKNGVCEFSRTRTRVKHHE